jgi:hypothetical protein
LDIYPANDVTNGSVATHHGTTTGAVSGIDRCETTSNQVVCHYFRFVHPSPESCSVLLAGWRQRLAAG